MLWKLGWKVWGKMCRPMVPAGEDLFLEMNYDSIRRIASVEHVRSQTHANTAYQTRLWRIDRSGELYCSAVVAEFSCESMEAILGTGLCFGLHPEIFFNKKKLCSF